MQPTPRNPIPKIEASRCNPPKLADSDLDKHEEGLIDESVDESFPASDPPASANPGSTLAVKSVAESGRETPPAEPDPGRHNLKPARE